MVVAVSFLNYGNYVRVFTWAFVSMCVLVLRGLEICSMHTNILPYLIIHELLFTILKFTAIAIHLIWLLKIIGCDHIRAKIVLRFNWSIYHCNLETIVKSVKILVQGASRAALHHSLWPVRGNDAYNWHKSKFTFDFEI